MYLQNINVSIKYILSIMNYNKIRKKKLKNCTFDNKGLIKAKRLLKKTNYKYKKNFKKNLTIFLLKKN